MSKPTGGGNGHGPAPGQPAPAKAGLRPRDVRQARFALSFSQIVAVLMRDPGFKNLRLADLEWLVLPAVMSGQFRLAQAPMQPMLAKVTEAKAGGTKGASAAKDQEGGVLVPVAVALWARVSAKADKALSETLDKQVRLHPADWASGDHVWLMAVAGDRRAMPKFLEQLREKEFKDKPVKMRMRSADGKITIKTLGEAAGS